jgi:hypothetical protein
MLTHKGTFDHRRREAGHGKVVMEDLVLEVAEAVVEPVGESDSVNKVDASIVTVRQSFRDKLGRPLEEQVIPKHKGCGSLELRGILVTLKKGHKVVAEGCHKGKVLRVRRIVTKREEREFSGCFRHKGYFVRKSNNI